MTFAGFVAQIIDILSGVVPLIFSLTLLVIVWKVVSLWIMNPGEADKIEEGKKIVVVGVIALVIMSGIWGILAILRDSLF
ncbi:MAG: hypothetical protein R3B69_03625 [Candidatus Paceibacterota bacterium]